MRYASIFLLLISLSFTACKDDEKAGTLVLKFQPVFDGDPLSTFVTKPFDNGQQIQFSLISMMVADLQLLNGAGQRDLRDIELVDMSFDTPAEAAEGFVVTLTDIPSGQYTGLRFGIGVPPDLNQQEPSDFSSSNPLSRNGYYWSAWNSYIFAKTEGRMDTLGNGSFDLGFALHTGADPLYRVLEWSLPLSIADGQTTSVNLQVDYQDLLQGMDIKSNPQNHNPQDTLQIKAFTDRLVSAITIVQ